MELISPHVLWWLLAVPLILLFGLWRTRPSAVTIPSLRLWEELRERHPPIRELRRPALQLSLILQALAAALLVLALAGPQLVSSRSLPRAIFILLDDSASMMARGEGTPMRWELACTAVELIAAQAAPDDRLIVTTGHAYLPSMKAGPHDRGATGRYDGPPGGAEGWLRGVRPRGCGEETVIRAARLLAAECGTGPGRMLVVISDHREPDVEAAVKPAGGTFVTVGAPVRNAGILALACEPVERDDAGKSGGSRGATAVTGARIFLRCAGPPGDTLEVDIRASDDGSSGTGRFLGTTRVALDKQGEGSLVVPLDPAPAERVIEARLRGQDALPVDDAAFVVRGGGGPAVVYVSPRPGHLAVALQSIPSLVVEIRIVEAGKPAPVYPTARLAVYDDVVPDRLPEGQWVVLANPPASVGPFEVAEPSGVTVDTWRTVPPLTQHVDLPSIAVRRARGCRLKGGIAGVFRSILESRDRGPLLGFWERPGGSVLYVGFDLTWRGATADSASTWPLDPSFPIFWKNVVDAALAGAVEGTVWFCGRTCTPLNLGAVESGRLGNDANRNAGIEITSGTGGDGLTRVLGHQPSLVMEQGSGGLRPVAALNLFDGRETACAAGGGMEPAALRLPAPPVGRRERSFAEACAVAAAVFLLAAWALTARSGK